MSEGISTQQLTDRRGDQWLKLATAELGLPNRSQTHAVDVAVLGGGMAGICAAVSAARNGAKVLLIQDRAVLGGNASSEIRVIVHGVTRLNTGKAERETGIIEEILLHNRFHNPQHSYPVWDHVLYDFVVREPNLELMLNTQALRAEMEGNRIRSAVCWQATTESVVTVRAQQFIDCSGDGLLAATAGALYRTGREASSEFGEKFAPEQADGWQMGPTILLSSEDMGKPVPFKAPSFTIPFDVDHAHPNRRITPFVEGFWWVEVGSDDDIIADAEVIRHKLLGYAYGVWEYVKNSGKYPEAENYALGWVGSLSGRRESRRFIGDYILSEPDQLEHKHFDDAVAYGGWPLDEHNPGGIERIGDPPSFWHEHFDRVYQIPFRSLYSGNIENLLFAGRNVSQTHVALSSSRVMATCATMGQAVGTAAALCVRHGVNPRGVYEAHIDELQEQLLRDDAYIPQRPAHDRADLARQARHFEASSTQSGDPSLLIDGVPRDEHGETHHWQSQELPANVTLSWSEPVELHAVLIKADTNVHRNIMMLKRPKDDADHTSTVPIELVEALEVEVQQDNGEWRRVASIEQNPTRRIHLSFEPVTTKALRVCVLRTYGADQAKLFEVRCYGSTGPASD
ncbi:FAD-dependent oxidoreductase [Algisphaera agarilytica]|uniref:FAD dependent oxidoreductase n=1 Tax=Algisphaera agarilytica TaxID=1385975 RepID=A0A7X0LJU8_9BACT|nr:FAD-dependent oxidoreductase [Algisphaera agarilytica]MBB6429149.1 hypothetical protein [Algisphaera agarilytica]